MVIYCITNKINGKQYVGQTTYSMYGRWLYHLKRANKYFLNSIKKYGKENFDITQIDQASTIEELNEKEKYWIKELNTVFPHGYNFEIGGKNSLSHSTTKKLLSDKKKIYYKSHKNPFYGRHHSEESKIRISKSVSGSNHHNYGKTSWSSNNDTFKQYMSNKLKSLWKDPTYRKNQLDARLGKKRGPYNV